MKIQKLPSETRSKLQSGMIVTDAVQCVLELVHNSLDADATGIAVRIDLKSYKIWVIDNGKGIGRDDLELIGERFMTSKYQSVNTESSFPTYGCRGLALSSLQEVSRSLIIETKSESDGSTFRKVFQNSRALPITEADCEKEGTGTTVTVVDFMYKMPVRRKRISEVFDLEEIKIQLQYLAIIHHHVCFTLRNENKNLILLQTPQASNILESLKNIYGKSLAKSLKTLYYKEKQYEITGFISGKSPIQDNVQLLYLNKRIITKGVIHKFINNLTKEYSGKKALLSDSPVPQIMKNIKVSSHSAFVILIHCPNSYYELFTNSRKTTVEFRNWKDVLKCIHKAVKKTFKSFKNLDDLSNSLQGDDELKRKKSKADRRVFGTSFLLNAVKGAPAKRSLNVKRDGKKRKKMKMNENENFGESLPKPDEKLVDNLFVDNSNTITKQAECVNDSLESPIPKKNFKFKTLYDLKHNEIANVDESFLEFYRWLKVKFETDTNAFNLYNDFLQFKNTKSHAKDAKEFKSPILAVKPKAKKVIKSEKRSILEKEKKCKDLSAVDEEMDIMAKRQLRNQKSAQILELNNNIPEKINLNRIMSGNLNFGKCNSQSEFKKSEIINFFNKTQVDSSPSLPSSEVQLTNIIKFRNLPESFFHQTSEIHCKIPIEKTFCCSISNSWTSHYEDFVSKNVEFLGKGRSRKNYFSWPEIWQGELPKKKKNLDLDYYNFLGTRLAELTYKAKGSQKLKNAQIQVDMTEIPAQTVNALVQTCNKVSESSSFENSFIFKEGNDTPPKGHFEYDVLKNQNKSLKCNLINDGVPYPDFWNTTAHMEFEKNNARVTYDMNDIKTKNLTSDAVNTINSTSSDFICGHKSRSSNKLQNEGTTSKETQTLIAIWPDSLTGLGCAREQVKINNKINQSKGVAKNIEGEEIQDDISQPDHFKFSLTERHDFVPKGLSPAFLNPEIGELSSLVPFEKCKLKLTFDDAQSELLANIKWQDDSTGDCLKPTIPDSILSEMRRKAGDIAMNYENPILTASVSYFAVKVHNLLHSFAFTKELLSGVEILGQLDKKFIVTKIKILGPKQMELISLFDQHAVDERIKLEDLINKNLSVDGKLVSSCLNSPVECFLSESEVRVVSLLEGKLLNYGLSAEPVNDNTVLVNKIPTFLLNKHEKDLQNKKETALSDAVKALIINIVEEITETRGGAVSKIPKVLYNALCLEACHKAIKFNKLLTTENMSEMIQKLRECKLPFQCAHGRPSVIPIIDLEDFNLSMHENGSINFQELKAFLDERKLDAVITDETV